MFSSLGVVCNQEETSKLSKQQVVGVLRYKDFATALVPMKPGKFSSSVAPVKSLYFHWTAICSSSIVFTPRSLFLLFVLLFRGLIVEDLTTAFTTMFATHSRGNYSSKFILSY